MSANPNLELHSKRSAAIIDLAVTLAVLPSSTDAQRREAVRTAYEIGLAEGKVIGGVEMRDCLMGSLRSDA